MARIVGLEQIKGALKNIDVVSVIEEGFVKYSSHGNVVVPPVGEMIIQDPPWDVHIKIGLYH
ncbi:MAG: hypothetical protein JRJ78_11980 [Deltaproteobacteria bacterium]|nr:hypothetical protein [Deltaproteobacteria bacterium]MBW2304680.1 hypothetical protein [Deltaproteobacteria bacterium]